MTLASNTRIHDSQATKVEPCAPEKFDIEAYMDYEQQQHERCKCFWQADSSVLVYRRMRIREVFASGCQNMKESLAWQLGGLQESLKFQSDIPNFLEPWYGIGSVASAFGIDYFWPENQAPAIEGSFNNTIEALEYLPIPVENTRIGLHTLNMIEYFLDKTKGKIPLSLADSQSPFNIAGHIIDTTNLMVDILTHPEEVKKLLDRIAGLALNYTEKQLDLLEKTIVWPGHGFPSSREFKGMGMSDDNMLMISGDQYLDICAESITKYGEPFSGTAFHSCGDWSTRLNYIMQIDNLKMVDGAFSQETDPRPNPTEGFKTLAHSGIVLNARIVGSADTVAKKVKELWTPGLKLIVTTYCQTPEEQAEAYERIHEICEG
jgi:hypothetical protein